MSAHLRPGDTFRRRGQKYRYDGLVDHRTEEDRWVELAGVTTRCAECGCQFSFRTRQRNLRRGPLSRRCDLHKQPGVPVRPKRGKSRELISAERFRAEQRRRALAAKREGRAHSHRAMKAEAAAERQRRRAETAKRMAEQERQRAEAAKAEAKKAKLEAAAQRRIAEEAIAETKKAQWEAHGAQHAWRKYKAESATVRWRLENRRSDTEKKLIAQLAKLQLELCGRRRAEKVAQPAWLN